MSTFYYLAVSGDRRRINGEIEAVSDAVARTNLNKMGLSVLSISSQPPVTSHGTLKKTFEFEAIDRFKKMVNGTIDVQDALGAYERLTNEFKFEVHYLCAVDATPAEKQIARDSGMKRLQDAEAVKKALEIESKKPLMKMSLGQIVERAEAKLKTKSAVKETVIATPIVESSDEDRSLDSMHPELTNEQSIMDQEEQIRKAIEVTQQKTAVKKVFSLDVADAQYQEAASAGAVKDEFTSEDFDFNQNASIDLSVEQTKKTKLLLEDRPLVLHEVTAGGLVDPESTNPKTLEDLALELTPMIDLANQSADEDRDLSIASPLFWKGDAEGRGSKKVAKLTVESSHSDEEKKSAHASVSIVTPDHVEPSTTESLLENLNFSLDSSAFMSGAQSFARTLVVGSVLPVREAVGEVLTGVLVSVLSAFVVLTLLARYHLAGVSVFSATVVEQGTLFAFLVFAILVYRLLVAAHGAMTRDVSVRSSVLYAVGSVMLVIIGVNLAY